CWINVTKEGSVEFESGKQPESLIKQIIEMRTEENDIILDFLLGSGTTTEAAHKMNRNYIGIVQMSYNEDITVPKMHRVVYRDNIYEDNRIITYITKAELEEVDSEFENMDLKDKKKALISLIDKNKLYVNFSDIEDENYNIKDEDKKFNKLFYEREV